MSARIVSIRPKVYRGKAGFSVIGYARRQPGDQWADWWRASIWTETRASAEKIRAKLRNPANDSAPFDPSDWTDAPRTPADPLDLTPQARDARMIEPGCQRIESELSHLFGER